MKKIILAHALVLGLASRAMAQTLQGAADFRLKHNNQRQNAVHHEVLYYPLIRPPIRLLPFLLPLSSRR